MPDRRDGEPVEDRIERLNRAIDRLVDGGAAPVLQDPDLQDLLSLAGRLYLELPRDLPDPAFRTRLKAQLTDEHPAVGYARAVPSAVGAPRRFPYVAALAGIAALLIAVAVVGSLALWSQPDNDRTTDGSQQALDIAITATTPLTASSLELATSTVVGVEIETPDVGPTTALAVPTEFINPTPAATESGEPAVDEATSVSTDVPIPAEPTALPVGPEATQSIDGGLASLPVVDETTVEDGPMPLASGGGSGPGSGVTFVLNTQLPRLDSTATAYILEPPLSDPEIFVSRAAAAIGISGDVQIDDMTGEAEYRVDSADGATFRWYPSTGEFSYAATPETTTIGLDGEQALGAALDWLTRLGYPVDQLNDDASVQRIGDAQWLIEMRLDAMPQPGVGHHLGTRIIVEGDGLVTSATGYWLDVTGTMTVPLLTADEAWSAAQSGAGYWADGGATGAGGEFRCGSISLSYVLTESGDGLLILQPVIKLDATFVDTVGSATPVSIYVQATRQGGEDTP